MKSENLPSKSQFLSYEDIKGSIITTNNYNNKNTEIFKKEDNLYDIKRISSENIKQPASYNYETNQIFKNSNYDQQSSGSKSPDLQFKKKTKDFSVNQGIDIAENLRPVQSIKREFSLEDFEIIEKLGRGTYGDVFLVR